jgi:hypothetical protein
MLIPAAQAFSSPYTKVNAAGPGKGEVTSGVEEGKGKGYGTGTPRLSCSYNGVSTSGTCENVPTSPGENAFYVAWLVAHPAAGSEFGGWKVTNGPYFEFYGEFSYNCPANALSSGYQFSAAANECQFETIEPGEPGQDEFEVTATFCKEGTAIEEEVFSPVAEANETRLRGCAEPTGPTNLRTLTLTKSPSSSTGGGIGSVSSKPKGIKCGTACDEAVADMYKNASVELAAKPSTGSTFVKWVGGDCNGSTAPTCTVGMDKDEATEAVFGGTSKAFSPAEVLTVSKGESSGKGTVKAAGLGCEAECSSTTVLYQGPITEPKAKPGKTVVLKQAPAFGSTFSGWSGCDSETEAGECVVAMSEAKEVVAEYTALPSKTLTINKSYSSGNGSVASKPKGIKCAATCTSQSAQMPEGASVELVAKPSTGTFVKWVGGDCNGSTSTTCVAVMNTNETIEAVFSDPGKAFSPAETLTLTKDGSGLGTVKASGLTCEVLCSSASSIYQGPITLPKAKPGKVVVLKAVSAPGSKAVEWSGCDSIDGEGNCVVAMETSKEVTATFDELE